MNKDPLHVFIGYDEREKDAFHVAEFSLKRRTDYPVIVHKLDHRKLRQMGMFSRPWRVDESGQFIDERDGKPFSTQFSHTRFLVPELWKLLPEPKLPFALFVDCDWLFLKDVSVLIEELVQKKLARNGAHPVYCVQHDYRPDITSKMDGMAQIKYNCKLWSSFMVFDMEHPDCLTGLSSDYVNVASGRDLHTFKWLSDEHSVGNITEQLNFIPDHSEKNTDKLAAIHYTSGGPWFPHLVGCKYGDLWIKEYNAFLASTVQHTVFDTSALLY